MKAQFKTAPAPRSMSQDHLDKETTGYLEKGTINGSVYNIGEVIKGVEHRLAVIADALGNIGKNDADDSIRKEDPKPYSVLDGLSQIESRLYHVADSLAKIERHIGGIGPQGEQVR